MPKEVYEAAKEYFELWQPKIQSALKTAQFCLSEGEFNDAAFMLHQATERSYHAVLLTLTLYSPPGHNIQNGTEDMTTTINNFQL